MISISVFVALVMNQPWVRDVALPVIVLSVAALLLDLYWKRRQKLSQKAQESQNVKVIFAGLNGKGGRVQTRHLRQALAQEITAGQHVLPIEFVKVSKKLALDEEGTVKIIRTGRALLEREQADILIWGQIYSGGSEYTLSFIKKEVTQKQVFPRLLCGVETIKFKQGTVSRADALTVLTLAMAHAFESCADAKKAEILNMSSMQSRLEQGLVSAPNNSKPDGNSETLSQIGREGVWAYGWWVSVQGLNANHKAWMVDATLVWVELLKSWPAGDSGYDTASARNNLSVVCFFLGERTQDKAWYARAVKQGKKAQSYFRKTGFPRRWAELEFLVLSASGQIAIKAKDLETMLGNEAAFLALQAEWGYDENPDFWVRIDVELDRLRQNMPQKSPVGQQALPNETDTSPDS